MDVKQQDGVSADRMGTGISNRMNQILDSVKRMGRSCMSDLAKRVGFTLIELMVVIAIIAILVALTTPMVGRAFQSANRARASTEARSIQNAVMNYLNEYGRFPHDNDLGDDLRYGSIPGAGRNNRDLMLVLFAIADAAVNHDHVNNPRQIVFLEAPEESLNEETGFNYHDPWDQQYEIIVDTSFDNNLTMSGIPALDPPLVTEAQQWNTTITNRRVGVWSAGNEPDNKDRHIRTW